MRRRDRPRHRCARPSSRQPRRPAGPLRDHFAAPEVCPKRAPGDRRLQRVPGETLTFRAQFACFSLSVERKTRTTEQRGGLGGVGVEAHATKSVVGQTQMRLGRSWIVDNELDDAGELLNFQQRMAQPSSVTVRRAESIIRRAAAARPRKASNTAWHRVDVASTAGESVVIRSNRTTSRHRPPARGTGLGPHSAARGAFARTLFTRRCSRARRAAVRASSSATSQSPILPSRVRHVARTVWALASLRHRQIRRAFRRRRLTRLPPHPIARMD